MNIRLKRQLNALFICGTVIVLAFLVACEPPVQPRAGTQEQLSEPSFQPSSGNITRARIVTIFARSGETIHYTTNGSDPATIRSGNTRGGLTPQQVRFTSFRVGNRVTVKAIAGKGRIQGIHP